MRFPRMKAVRRFLRAEQGRAAVEYLVMLWVVVMVAWVAISWFGTKLPTDEVTADAAKEMTEVGSLQGLSAYEAFFLGVEYAQVKAKLESGMAFEEVISPQYRDRLLKLCQDQGRDTTVEYGPAKHFTLKVSAKKS